MQNTIVHMQNGRLKTEFGHVLLPSNYHLILDWKIRGLHQNVAYWMPRPGKGQGNGQGKMDKGRAKGRAKVSDKGRDKGRG